MMVVATTRLYNQNLNGSVADTSIASICSVTRIDPSSAPILEPTLPADINAVIKGASARTIAIAISPGNHEERLIRQVTAVTAW